MQTKHIHHVIPTGLCYWLTKNVRSWNQQSEFLHRDIQNNRFGPDNILKSLMHNHCSVFKEQKSTP